MSEATAVPHVVIVEDEEILQKFLVYHVEHAGFRATPTSSGTEMFRIVDAEPVDLILLDLGLPDGDGLSWAQKIRERGDIPIVVLTGRKGDDDRIMALGLGADDYLTKPCDPRELLLRIRNILGRVGKTEQSPRPAAPRVAPSESSPSGRRAEDRATEKHRGERRHDSGDRRHAERADRRGVRRVSPAILLICGLLIGAAGSGVAWYLAGSDDTSAPLAGGTASQTGALTAPEPSAPSTSTGGEAATTQSRSKQMTVTAQPAPTRPAAATVEEKPDDPTPPANPSGLQTETETDRPVAATSYAWVLRSKCAEVPDVAWWRIKKHTDIVRYVNRRHVGDWLPYIKTWTKRLAKLKDIHERGSGIRTKTDETLTGDNLAVYIDQTRMRLEITKCLSQEAADYAYRRSQIRK